MIHRKKADIYPITASEWDRAWQRSTAAGMWSRFLSIMVAFGILMLVGCGGCRRDPVLSKEELAKQAKEREKNVEIFPLQSTPYDGEQAIMAAKPGHWLETRQEFKSNREDLQVVTLGSVIRGSESVTLPGTNVLNQYSRRTSLPRGQMKSVDLQYFVPPVAVTQSIDPLAQTSTALKFQTELLSWPLLTPITAAPFSQPARELRENEFQMVVLSPQAANYSYFASLDAIHWRGDELMVEERTRSYYVTLLKPDNNRYAMPRSMLTMTAIAVIVWDDVSPDNLSAEQQDALIDWLHWGGQLVVSGPGSWSRLQNSFLSPYLPARSGSATEFRTEDFDSISDQWVVKDLNAAEQTRLNISGPAVAGLDFELSEAGSWLPGSGNMVAEASVGRGRLVLTSFPLREPRIFNWKYFSNFFSTGLLRRAPRIAKRRPSDNLLTQVFAEPYSGAEFDARMHSSVRIASRDLPLTRTAETNSGQTGLGMLNLPDSDSLASESRAWGGQAAAWNDYSGLAFQAVATLRAAAGIELPSRTTIMYLLAGYLLFLVPVNWLVFRVLGRLEYAWAVAPVLAFAGVLVVTRIAQLDIGFARRTTEVSVLELQGDHDRAHLTQYIALYTSLSTNYEVEFPENGSVALPLGDSAREQRRAGSELRNLRTNYGRSEGVTLEPLTVYSNSTEMLHAEQMIQLPGGLQLGTRGSGQEALKNATGFDIRSAMVIRRLDETTIQFCWLGDLASGETTTLTFAVASGDDLWRNWLDNPITQPSYPGDDKIDDDNSLWLGGVLHGLVQKTPLAVGQTRLFGYTDSRPGNLELSPQEDQFDGRCAIVAHLTPATLPAIQADVNILSRISGLGAGNIQLPGDEADSDATDSY